MLNILKMATNQFLFCVILILAKIWKKKKHFPKEMF